MIMSAQTSLPLRLRAVNSAQRMSLFLSLLGLALSAMMAPTSAHAQPSRRMASTRSSRLQQQPESIATPPATSTAPSGQPQVTTSQPVYEFEGGSAPGETYYAPAGQGPVSGAPGDAIFADQYFDDAMMADQAAGYSRYGGVGRYGCSPILPHGFCWQQVYLRADYLLWWGKGMWAPPLVTTSSPGTSLADAGVLGLPTTSVLFPTETLADASQSGGRARIGYWFDHCDIMAVEGTYFAIGQASSGFSGNSSEYPILARPFINVTPGSIEPDAQVISYPGLYTGDVSVTGTSSLQGVEVIVRHLMARGCDWRIDWTLGWRYNRLDDNLLINANRLTLGSPTAPNTGATLSEYDQFSADNYFNGVQLGIITETKKNRWWLETRATLALGNNRSYVTIDGQTTTMTAVPGAGTVINTYDGGLLAMPSNIGVYKDDDFAIVPQIGVNLGYEICCGLWATVGYNFMYWSSVARPGDQIDSDVNLSQAQGGNLLGIARPGFTEFITDYWAQGLNFGLAYRF